MNMVIFFYKISDEYGEFSNFSHYGFELDGKWWMTSEHYFQAQKFKGTQYEERIRLLDNPMKAAQLGRNRDLPLREDWEKVKDDVMRNAVYAKFSQNIELKKKLIATYPNEIIEKTSNDYYWGCGCDGTGKNMLGKIIMETRNLLMQK